MLYKAVLQTICLSKQFFRKVTSIILTKKKKKKESHISFCTISLKTFTDFLPHTNVGRHGLYNFTGSS